MSIAYPLHWREPRGTGLALTLLVHAALFAAWQMGRPLPVPDGAPEPVRMRVQWIRLAPPAASMPAPVGKPLNKPLEKPAQAARPPARAAASTTPVAPRRPAPVPAQQPLPQPAPQRPPVPAVPGTTGPAVPHMAAPQPIAPLAAPAKAPSAADIVAGARREIGKIERDLRKENRPYIVLPPDSPQLRMERGMDAAHDLAAPRMWEAPRIEALVNDTGDGARRERVITGNGTYCVTDRGINTSIDMIEKHGKQRFTSCPQHEQPATRQAWRSARD